MRLSAIKQKMEQNKKLLVQANKCGTVYSAGIHAKGGGCDFRNNSYCGDKESTRV